MPEQSHPLVQLAGSERGPLAGATPAGQLDTSERAELTLVLRRRAEIRMQQIDATHPPTTMRADYIAAAPYVGEPAVDLDRVPPASEELRRTRSAVDRALQSRFGA